MIRSHDDLHVLLNGRVTELFFSQNLLLYCGCSGTGSLEEQRKSAELLHLQHYSGQRAPSECAAKP